MQTRESSEVIHQSGFVRIRTQEAGLFDEAMGKGKKPDPPSLQKYGVPFYSAAWVPYKEVRSKLQPQDPHHPDDKDEDSGKENPPPASQQEIADQYYLVLAGGGGEGRSGIPNAIVLSHFDFASNSLSAQPVC